MKKFVCFLVVLCFALNMVGCKNVADTTSNVENETSLSTQDQGQKTVSLLYSYSDTLNPYTAVTASNRELSSLLYDSLIKTDNNFDAVCVLAKKVDIKDKTCTVTLRDATFTDGSTVTAQDVIYSYKIAKETPRFTQNFYEVVSVSATNDKTVVFNLSQNDPLFANLLTFPIIKLNTSGITDQDGKEIVPIGCGRYYLSEDGLSLTQNKNHFGKKGVVGTINLINSPDDTSTAHYVEVGAATIYYTEGDKIVRMSGKKTDVNLNRLIYIGVNNSYGALQNKEMRYAISSALNRDAICQSAYHNNAIAANGFFNPLFKETSALQSIESKPNSKITVENLSKIGYNIMSSNGFYANKVGNSPVFSLLVNSENASRVAAANLIAAQCKAAGIQINVIECSYEQYVARLEGGHFQLYLGEVQVLNNMDFTNLVVAGGSAAFGVKPSKPEQNDENKPTVSTEDEDEPEDTQDTALKNSCEQILNSYHKGECGINDVAGVLLTEMPHIPVCYLNGVLFYDSAITGGVAASSSDIYFSFENYEF